MYMYVCIPFSKTRNKHTEKKPSKDSGCHDEINAINREEKEKTEKKG